MKTKFLLSALFVLGLLASPAMAASSEVSNYTPLKIYQTVDPEFPRHMMSLGLEGEAKIAIRIDADGKLAEYLVIGYTRKAFAEAAIDAIKEWRFDAARLAGQPIPAVSELNFHFAATGVVVNLDFQGAVEQFYHQTFARTRYDYSLCSMREIDRIPVPISVVNPAYPGALPKQGVSGKVRITFFIDEQGKVRLPSVIEADDYVLAEFAIDAIRKWKFEPPTRKGEPVLVKASQLFKFDPKTPPETPKL